MKKTILLLLLTIQFAFAQQPYYNDVDLNLTGQDLYFELQAKIDNASNSFNYGDVRDTVKITDEDTSNSNNVLLVYGFDDSGSCKTDRTRDKDDYGGSVCEYNREHVFARSNANPSMGDADNSSNGIVADPHNIRPSDQQMNGDRGNKKFTDGSGNSGNTSGNWYPGDEWKGDVARMMMYMYTRYGNRCLPSLNGTGATQGSTDMLQIYLQWNIEDPVSAFEDQRNPHLQTVYGNRNPFIDNPYLATIIWGGEPAEDRWGLFSTESFTENQFIVYPNPFNEQIWIQNNSSIDSELAAVIYDVTGRIVFETSFSETKSNLNIATLSEGMYLLEISNSTNKVVKRIIKQ
ncbi:MAG: endonuclease [Flavobacteriaceae bacterium]|nr:endonuclease [Flavobacteriaceae bacterium]